MAFTIDSGPITAEDRLRHVPREKWHDLMLARRYFMEVKLSHDCRCLVEFVDDAKEMFSELGFVSVEAMIRDGYNLVPEEINIALEWLRLNPPDEPLPLEQAIKFGRHGGDRRSLEMRNKITDQPDNVSLKGYGNSRAYMLARLDRDKKTELAAKVRNGEMSANAAAIKAGFRKKPLKRCPECGHEWR